MKKILILLPILLLLNSCFGTKETKFKKLKNENTLGYEIKKEEGDSILFLIKNGKKIEIENAYGEIKNIEFINKGNNLIIYDVYRKSGRIKKVFDIDNKKELIEMYFGNITKNKKYIYSCEDAYHYNTNVFNLQTLKSINYTKKMKENWRESILGESIFNIKKCGFEYPHIYIETYTPIKDRDRLDNYFSINIENRNMQFKNIDKKLFYKKVPRKSKVYDYDILNITKKDIEKNDREMITRSKEDIKNIKVINEYYRKINNESDEILKGKKGIRSENFYKFKERYNISHNFSIRYSDLKVVKEGIVYTLYLVHENILKNNRYEITHKVVNGKIEIISVVDIINKGVNKFSTKYHSKPDIVIDGINSIIYGESGRYYSQWGFTKNEKYFYICGERAMLGIDIYKIYETKNWTVVKNFKNIASNCEEYDEKRNILPINGFSINEDLPLNKYSYTEYEYNFETNEIILLSPTK